MSTVIQQPKPETLADAVAKVRQTLVEAEGEVQLDTSQLSAADKKALVPLLRVPDEAITIVIDAATRYPERFPYFDVAGARYAVAYDQTVDPLVQACKSFVMRLEESVFKRRAKAAQDTLAAYASMKSLSRFSEGQSMLPEIQRLKLLVRPYAPSRRGASTGTKSANKLDSTTSKELSQNAPPNGDAQTSVKASPQGAARSAGSTNGASLPS